MKKIILTVLVTVVISIVNSQEMGNRAYRSQILFSSSNIDVSAPMNSDVYVSVKGMANVKAESYLAIFNVSQVGKSAEEVNQLMENRIQESITQIKSKEGVEVFVDMVSFVPVYELEVEKKVFSKKTYSEVPAGFELKKNIHIRYKNQALLNEFIQLLAKNEIYDLVSVDYFSSQLETIKKELMTKAKTLALEKMKNNEALTGATFEAKEKDIMDGYKIVYPVEQYRSYAAFSSTSLNLNKNATVNQANKSTTQYYQPIIDKEFDFVINPLVMEPVIQVMYEVIVIVRREEKVSPPKKEFVFITPSGETKVLDLK